METCQPVQTIIYPFKNFNSTMPEKIPPENLPENRKNKGYTLSGPKY